MSEEKITEEKTCKCFCKSEGLKYLLIIALGSFIGVYMALSVFAATHRPRMPRFCPHMNPMQMQRPFENNVDFHRMHRFNKEFKGDVNKVKTPEAND